MSVDAMVAVGSAARRPAVVPAEVGGDLEEWVTRSLASRSIRIDRRCGRGHPGLTWLVADLAELDLAAMGIDEGFDVVVCAGNVMSFLAPHTDSTCSNVSLHTCATVAAW